MILNETFISYFYWNSEIKYPRNVLQSRNREIKYPKNVIFFSVAKFNTFEVNITGRNKLPIRKRFEKNDLTIAVNVLYTKKEKIYPAYV